MARKEEGRHFKHTGEFLRRGRAAIGMPQTRLAEDLDIKRQFISKVEHGEFKMPWKYAARWADVLGLNLTSLYRCIEKDMKADFKKVTGCKVK